MAKRHNNKGPHGSPQSRNDDMENSSILGQARSVRGALSDWDSTAGGGVVLGAGGGGGDPRLPPSVAVDGDDDAAAAAAESGRHRPIPRVLRWWSDVLSRVSQSASSLLSQHAPGLNDILEGTGEAAAPPPLARTARGARDAVPGGPRGAEGIEGERERERRALKEEVASLRRQIEKLEEERRAQTSSNAHDSATDDIADIPSLAPVRALRPEQVSRYSRQLLLADGFGVAGQKQLLSSSILVVGAGGIGSTVLLYLAAAGVGHLTVVDYDRVETSNLHRQVIHRDDGAAGFNKALSAKRSLRALNPTLSCTALAVAIDADNALELASRHDVVVDASDNPRTRYLLNDACVLAGKPLISGSAMGTEGQLTVYNHPPPAPSDRPTPRAACYRCLYPNPDPAEGCKSCSDNGVLGMVPGVIGVLQAVEVIKVITGIGNTMHDRLLMYDALDCSFLNIKKPPARPKCAVNSPHATIKCMEDSGKSLENVRGPSANVAPTPRHLPEERIISCVEYSEVRKKGAPHVLLDVRAARQYDMCALEGSVNVPLDRLAVQLDRVGALSHGELPVYCLCRRGIASATATDLIHRAMEDGTATAVHSVTNIAGGLNSWVDTVDPNFPRY